MKRRTLIAWWPVIFLVALTIFVLFYVNVLVMHTGVPAR